MERQFVVRHFESIGARARFSRLESRLSQWHVEHLRPGAFSVDISTDRRGSYFDIAVSSPAQEFEVLQKDVNGRHLLLMSRDGHRFLCGHDERDWFVAEVAERVSTVEAAKRALMPRAIREAADRRPPAATAKRKNALFVRQGEWFFVPVDREFPADLVHRNEPLQRGPRSKPHICEELYREGGELVWLVDGVVYTEKEYEARRAADRDGSFRRRRRFARVRNPEVYVRGAVRHPDHSAIRLEKWHRVYINGEMPAGSDGSASSFLD